MTYDLRRLRLAGLIRRIDHTNRYVLTSDGTRFAVFHTKLHNRLLRPLMAAGQPRHLRRSARPRTPSTSASTTTSPTRGSASRVKLDTTVQKLGTKDRQKLETKDR